MYCTNCGAKIVEGSKFCVKCGAPVDAPEQTPVQTTEQTTLQKQAQGPDIPEKKDGTSEKIKPKDVPKENEAAPVPENDPHGSSEKKEKKEKEKKKNTADRNKKAAEKAEKVLMTAAQDHTASENPGETLLFSSAGAGISSAAEVLTPFRTIISHLKSFFRGIKSLFTGKNIKGIIFASVMAAVWTVMAILAACGVNNKVIHIISVLTYSPGGGYGRNFAGMLGGIFGKCVFASSLFGLLGGGIKYLGKGFLTSFRFTAFGKKDSLPKALAGAGTAMLLLSASTGYLTADDLMMPLSSVLLTAQIAGRKDGFIYDFLKSFMRKHGNAGASADAFMTGINSGFILGTAAGMIPHCGWVPLYISPAFIIAAVILQIVFSSGRKAVTV